MRENEKAFSNELYVELQSKHIQERIAQFDNKLYLEFGENFSMIHMLLVFYLVLNPTAS